MDYLSQLLFESLAYREFFSLPEVAEVPHDTVSSIAAELVWVYQATVDSINFCYPDSTLT